MPSPLNFLWKSLPRLLLSLLWTTRPTRAMAIYFLVGYSLPMLQSEKHLTCLHCEIASVIFHRQANSLACQIYLRARFPVSFFVTPPRNAENIKNERSFHVRGISAQISLFLLLAIAFTCSSKGNVTRTRSILADRISSGND